ncbi:MAG TPA: methyltransferase [Dongiaceae bacterium]|nr:methyltransferase [Dongiaceae bacterium]
MIPADAAADTLLGGKVKIAQPADGYRVAVDAVLLAAAIEAEAGERVLDLGCGVGSVSLCLAWRRPQIGIVGLDREPAFLACAAANAAVNGMDARVTFLQGDVLDPPAGIRAAFDQAMLNPPYLKAGSATVSAHPLKAAATAESDATLPDWIACARAALKPGGILTMIHRADRLADCLAALRGFGGIVVLPIHPKAGRAAGRILIRARLGSGQPLSILPGFILHESDGRFTAAADAILRDGAALDLMGRPAA